jgi:hypothetical protein
MTIHNKILNARPGVSLSEFDIQDNCDGQGPFLAAWRSAMPRPSQDEIDAASAASPALSALEQIAALEASITDRMWREDAVGSTAVMTFSPDDPRTGKTATQYIAYVNSAIANVRAGL